MLTVIPSPLVIPNVARNPPKQRRKHCCHSERSEESPQSNLGGYKQNSSLLCHSERSEESPNQKTLLSFKAITKHPLIKSKDIAVIPNESEESPNKSAYPMECCDCAQHDVVVSPLSEGKAIRFARRIVKFIIILCKACRVPRYQVQNTQDL